MAKPNDFDDPDKFDHSVHPTDRRQPEDLHAPNGGKAERPARDNDSRGGVEQKEPVTLPDR